MSGDLSTQLDRPYAQQPATRDAATRYLERTGNGDLLDVLGLADEPARPGYVEMNGRLRCAACLNPVKADGVCRRTVCGGAR